jgi:ribosomal protein S9
VATRLLWQQILGKRKHCLATQTLCRGKGVICGSTPKWQERNQAAKIRLHSVLSLVEAGSNTSIVVLRVVGGDEKGTECLGL